MKRFIYTCLIFLSIASTCAKKENCHREILVVNHSNQSIIPAPVIRNTAGECILSGQILESGASRVYDKKDCWEQALSNQNFHLYIIDPGQFNQAELFYDCDSINKKNKVLFEKEFTLDELKTNNFTISYP